MIQQNRSSVPEDTPHCPRLTQLSYAGTPGYVKSSGVTVLGGFVRTWRRAHRDREAPEKFTDLLEQFIADLNSAGHQGLPAGHRA